MKYFSEIKHIQKFIDETVIDYLTERIEAMHTTERAHHTDEDRQAMENKLDDINAYLDGELDLDRIGKGGILQS